MRTVAGLLLLGLIVSAPPLKPRACAAEPGAPPPGPPQGAASSPTPQILIPGEYWREDITTDVEDGWLALVAADSGMALVPVHARFELRPHMSWSDAPSTIVSAREAAGAIFLLHDVAGLKPGPVQTWFRGNVHLRPGDSLPLLEPGRHQYRLAASPPVPLKNKIAGHEPYQNDLTIEDKATGTKQRLSTQLVDDPPGVQWVGDLDRDGGIDLLIADEMESGETIWVLLLSSYARRSEITARAASFHMTGD